MTCPNCKGTGEIVLFTSVEPCECTRFPIMWDSGVSNGFIENQEEFDRFLASFRTIEILDLGMIQNVSGETIHLVMTRCDTYDVTFRSKHPKLQERLCLKEKT